MNQIGVKDVNPMDDGQELSSGNPFDELDKGIGKAKDKAMDMGKQGMDALSGSLQGRWWIIIWIK